MRRTVSTLGALLTTLVRFPQGRPPLLLAATYPPDNSHIIPADRRISWQGLGASAEELSAGNDSDLPADLWWLRYGQG